MAPRAGFEPATIRLTVECSTAELPRNRRTIVRERAAYNKAFRACKGPNGRSGSGIARKRKGAVLQGFAAGFSPALDMIGNASSQCRHPLMSWTGRQIDSIRPEPSGIAGFTGADSMPVIATDLIRAVPSIIPSDIPALSEDECLLRLARAVEDHDSEDLDEVARLIGRLIATIE